VPLTDSDKYILIVVYTVAELHAICWRCQNFG